MSELSRPSINIKVIVGNTDWGATIDEVHKDVYLSLRDYLESLHRLGVRITRQQVLEEWYDQIDSPSRLLRNNVEEVIANVIRGYVPEVPETKPSGKIIVPPSKPYVREYTVRHSLDEWS